MKLFMSLADDVGVVCRLCDARDAGTEMPSRRWCGQLQEVVGESNQV